MHVILIAKTNQAHKHLSYQFEKRLIEKKYFAITWGSWKEEQGLIDRPIKRAKKDPTVFEVNSKGRNATTGYLLSKRGEYLNQVLPQVILDIDYRKNNLVISSP